MIERMLAAGFLGCVAALPAQNTYIVDASGGGNFTDLPPAVQAAQPNDTLIVRPGMYSGFTVRKGIRILGGPGVNIDPFSIIITVDGIPAGQTLVVRQLRSILGLSAVQTFFVTNCAGHVHLENIDPYGGLMIDNSQHVTVHRSTLRGFPGAWVRNSTALFVQCTVKGNTTIAAGLPGLLCDGSTVTFTEGTCTGSSELAGGFGSISAGVVVASGLTTIGGDAQTRIVAGTGSTGMPQPAIDVRGGAVVVDPAVSLVPTPGAPPIGGPGTASTQPVPSLLGTFVPSGPRVTLELHAPGSIRVHLLAGVPLSPPVAIPGLGELWLGTPPLLLDSGVVSATGYRTTMIPLPVLVPGAVAAFQSLVEQPSGPQLSAPVVLLIG